MRRLSEINLGCCRTLFQPFVRAFANEQFANWQHQMQPSELPFELFSDRNPLMQQVARLAESVREQRRPASPDNPWMKFQEAVSAQLVAALDGWRDPRGQTVEQIFLTTYGNPFVQALLGLGAADDGPHRRPGIEPDRLALMQERMAQLRSRLQAGGLREAAIRSLVYIGLAGPGVDERSFEVLRQIRAESEQGIGLQEFKSIVREQFFSLLLDQKTALAAIPAMLGSDQSARDEVLEMIRKVVRAIGVPEGVRAERLAEIERLFASRV